MKLPKRLSATALGLAAVLVAAADPAENLERLAAMPAAHRQRLAEALREFEALPAAERDAIRGLDRRLADLDEPERRRLLQVMHAYHLWLRGLPESDRRRVEQADPAERLAVVAQIREARRQQLAERPRPRQARQAYRHLLQVSSLSSEPMLISAIELSLWFDLSEELRAEIRRLDSPAKQYARFQQEARKANAYLTHMRTILERAELDRIMPIQAELAKLLKVRPEANPVARLKAAQARPRLEVVFKKTMWDYLQANEPESVAAADLRRFEEVMPSWIRESIDPLPPDAARERLEVLYRLVFPPGQELPQPAPKKAEPPKAPPPRPTGPSASPAPF